MKKLLGLTLALAMILPSSQASAELLKNFKLSGQIDLQAQASKNVTDFSTRQSNQLTQANLAAMTAGELRAASMNDRMNDAQTRVLLHLDWDLLDDVHAKVTLRKNDRTWGTQTGSGDGGMGATVNSQAIMQGAAGRNVLGNVFLDQAWFKVAKVMGALDVTFGRQFYGNPGDLVIYYGPSDKALYGLPSNGLDAARVDWMGDNLWITGIAGKDAGNPAGTVQTNAAAATNDIDVRGITAGYKVMDGLKIDAHVYNRLQHANGALGTDFRNSFGASGSNDNLYVYGLNAKWEGSGLSVGVEFEKNNGENRNMQNAFGNPATTNSAAPGTNSVVAKTAVAAYTGMAWKIDAAYKADVEGVASLMPWVQFAWGTGRGNTGENKNEGFHSINGDYRPGTIYGRFAATGAMALGSAIPCLPGAEGCANTVGGNVGFGTFNNGIATNGFNNLNNRVIFGLGLKTTPAALNQLTASVSWYSFYLQRVTSTSNGLFVNGNATNNGQGNGSGRQAKQLGSELDFDFTWKHSENVSFQTGVAGFRAGTYIKNIISDAEVSTANTAAARSTRLANNGATLAYFDARVKF